VFLRDFQTKELIQENAVLKEQMNTIKDHVLNVESEMRASQETITRLIANAERGEMSVSRYTLDVEGIRVVGNSSVFPRSLPPRT